MSNKESEPTVSVKEIENAPATAATPEPPTEKGIFDELYDHLFAKSWAMWVGCIILSVLSIGLYMIVSPWGSSGGILSWGQNMFDAVGLGLSNSAPGGVTGLLDSRYGMLSITMFLGAMGAALLAKEFAIRVPPMGEMAKGLVGGILMGIGAIIGMGCTIGQFYSGWPALSGGALVFVLGLFIGVFIAVKYLLWEMENHPNLSTGNSKTFLAAKTKGRSFQPLAGIIVLAIGVALMFLYDGATEQILIGFVLIGLMIGFVLQRSRFCIVRTLRETFLTGDSEPTQALIAGIIVGLFGFTIIKILGISDPLSMVSANFWVPAIVGGVIFGIGMTIAGGCTVGSTWRAAEGHVKLWLSLVGLVISLPLTAEYIKPAFYDMLPASMNQQMYLPDTFGYLGSICIILLILLLWYLFVKWNEKTGKLTAL
ncbi:MAG: YeeE/YedE thiosulfate transporter family protein [Thermoplasmata archaeon]